PGSRPPPRRDPRPPRGDPRLLGGGGLHLHRSTLVGGHDRGAPGGPWGAGPRGRTHPGAGRADRPAPRAPEEPLRLAKAPRLSADRSARAKAGSSRRRLREGAEALLPAPGDRGADPGFRWIGWPRSRGARAPPR